MTVGERIAKCRKNKNLSQEYVADKLGISRQSVSKWEKNITYPDTNNLIALAELLDTTVEYIACGKEQDVQPAPAKTNTSTQLYNITGLSLFALGVISLVLGLAVEDLRLLFLLGGLLISFGVLFVSLQKSGMFISLILTLLTAILALTVGLMDEDIAVMIVAYACYASLLCAVIAIVMALVRKKK